MNKIVYSFHRVMHQGTSVSVLDLHKFVEEKCKGSKIVDCDIFQDQPNVVGDDNDNIDDDDDDDDDIIK